MMTGNHIRAQCDRGHVVLPMMLAAGASDVAPVAVTLTYRLAGIGGYRLATSRSRMPHRLRSGDAVVPDLAIDRRPRHSQGCRRLRLVVGVVRQAADDCVALERLQLGENSLRNRST